MGDAVNTVGEGGVVIPRLEADARALGSEIQDPAIAEGQARAAARVKMFQSPENRFTTFVEGIVDGFTTLRETGEAADERRAANPWEAGIGTGLGVVGAIATGRGPMAVVNRTGEALGKAAAKHVLRAGEKSIVGAAVREAGAGAALTGASTFGHAVLDTVIEDRPFAGETILEQAGIGGLISAPAGALMGMFGKVASKGDVAAQGGFAGSTDDALHALDETRAAYGEALFTHEKQLGAMKEFRRAGKLADVSDDFIRVRQDAVSLARRAQARLRSIDAKAALSGADPKAYAEFQRALSDYTRSMEMVDDVMRAHPAEVEGVARQQAAAAFEGDAATGVHQRPGSFDAPTEVIDDLTPHAVSDDVLTAQERPIAVRDTTGFPPSQRMWEPPEPGAGTIFNTREADDLRAWMRDEQAGATQVADGLPTARESTAPTRADLDPLTSPATGPVTSLDAAYGARSAAENGVALRDAIERVGERAAAQRAWLAERRVLTEAQGALDGAIHPARYGEVQPMARGELRPDGMMDTATDLAISARAGNVKGRIAQMQREALKTQPGMPAMPIDDPTVVGQAPRFGSTLPTEVLPGRAPRAVTDTALPAQVGSREPTVVTGRPGDTVVDGLPAGKAQGALDAAFERDITKMTARDATSILPKMEDPEIAQMLMDEWMMAPQNRVRPWHEAMDRSRSAMDALYGKAGGRFDSARSLGVLEAEGLRRSDNLAGSFMDDVFAMNRTMKLAAQEARGIKTPLQDAAKSAVLGALGNKLARAVLGNAIGGPLAAAIGFSQFGGQLASASGRLAKQVTGAAQKFLTSTKVRATAVAATNTAWEYSDRGPIQDPVERIQEVQFLALNPETIRARVREQAGPLLMASPGTVQALEDATVRQVTQIAIRAPAIYFDKLGRPLMPPAGKLRQWYEYENAVHDLPAVLDAVGNGSLTKPQADALATAWSAVHVKLTGELMADPGRLQKFSREKLRMIEVVTGMPLTGVSDPLYMARQQQAWDVYRMQQQAHGAAGQRPQAFNINPTGAPTPSQANAQGRAPGN